MNELPGPGRFVHYVSKLDPHVESPALITGTSKDWVGMLPSAAGMLNNRGESIEAALRDGYESDRHVSLQVFGLVNVYPEWNIPYSSPFFAAARDVVPGDIAASRELQSRPENWKQPGTWHWWDECTAMNDHIHPVAPQEEP